MTRRRFIVLCIAECVCLVLIAAFGVLHRRSLGQIALSPLTEWEAPLGGLSISDGELISTYEQSSHPDRSDTDGMIEVTGSTIGKIKTVPAAIVETPDMILEAPIIARSDAVTLPRGDYTLTLNYTASVDQYAVLNIDGVDMKSAVPLSKNLSTTVYHFNISEKSSDVSVAVTYGFYGDFSLVGASLSPNLDGTKRWLTIFSALLVLADIIIVFRKKLAREKRAVLSVAVIAVLSVLPVFVSGVPLGHDLKFHLMRIDGLATELLYMQFPVRMQSLWMDGFSYPVSVLYGDIFLYLPAILRIFGFSVFGAYQIYIAVMDILLTAITYICIRKILKSDLAAFAAAAGYVLSAYRFVDVYARAAVGEAASYLSLPIIALALFRMYEEKNDSKPLKNGVILAIGMSFLLFSHNLSVLMTSVFLLIVALVMIKQTLKKEVLLSWIVAVIATVALSAVYLFPMADYLLHADLNSSVNADETLIQWGGAFIYQYFLVFHDYFGFNSKILSERMNLSPGLILMIGFVAALVHITLRHASKRTKYLFGFSALLLWLASDIFPWDFLSTHISTRFAMIQFPWRFLPLASMSLSLLLGSIVTTVEEHASARKIKALMARGMTAFFLACAVLSSAVYTYQTARYDYRAYYRDIAEVDHYCVTSFFLRDGIADDEPLTLSMAGHNGVKKAEPVARAGTTAIYEVSADRGDDIWFEAPVFNYPYYEAYDEAGERLVITDGDKKLIRVYLPEGYDGRVTIGFYPPTGWRAAEIISLFAWLAVILIWRRL